MRSAAWPVILGTGLFGPAVAGCGSSDRCPPAASPAPPAPPPAASLEVASSTPTLPIDADRFTVPPRPDWADKYADKNEGDMRFFDIEALMQAHSLSRSAAIELQNHYRDASRSGVGDATTWFSRALELAKRGEYEDGRDIERLETAPFIVVFDLDETLYDQYYDRPLPAECGETIVPSSQGEPWSFVAAPGWAHAFQRIEELGGVIALFSANADERTLDNLRAWSIDQTPLTEHPLIAGILTNSHLVLQTKACGNPVVEPSKDLRVFDASLERVIIVDDNPLRLFQLRNARATFDFDAVDYCVDGDEPRRAMMESTLAHVVDEIEEANAYRIKHGTSFVTAYLPYSITGQRVVEAAQASGMSLEDAVAWVRRHPDVVE